MAASNDASLLNTISKSGGSDDDSFSSDSDDDFLTIRTDGDGATSSSVDREALIRKKLLESFYGKSSSNLSGQESEKKGSKGNDDSDDDSDNDDDDDGEDGPIRQKTAGSSSGKGYYGGNNNRGDNEGTGTISQQGSNSNDLDSPQFHAPSHTSKHVVHSSVHSLLETEEQLALQVRTLDSTMQTLVYENYSRFIEATDAIRSIGINVQANEQNLVKLKNGMDTIDTKSRQLEAAVGSLRDQVVEKIRVKRLLTRLDALLKLPTTLRDDLQNGKYRLATKAYCSAYPILSKHSAGFESLQRIQTDCHLVMETMLKQIRMKLLHWSGKSTTGAGNDNADDSEDEYYDGDDDAGDGGGIGRNKNAGVASAAMKALGDGYPPDPPKNVAEIFECAGTPILVFTSNNGADEQENVASLDPGLTIQDCQEMSLAASLRLMERMLDSHHIRLQEEQFSTDMSGQEPSKEALGNSVSLVPTNVLDSILEAATLYQISFDDIDIDTLTMFVSDAFSSFLTHVRGQMLERQLHALQQATIAAQQQQQVVKSADDDDNAEEEVERKQDLVQEEMTTAMNLLLQSVRQLSSGLTLPEVGISEEFASSLVDQTINLTQAMVRRRVDQKFYNLRYRIVQECLEPFAKNAIQLESEDDEHPITQVVQMANVALSDALQLVDDTIRSILEEASAAITSASSSPSDGSMLRQAVESSTLRFAMWLASAMEILAGCEAGEMIDVKWMTPEEQQHFQMSQAQSNPNGGDRNDPESKIADIEHSPSGISEISHDNDNSAGDSERIEQALAGLLDELELHQNPSQSNAISVTRADLTLAIAEMCRLAERSVMDNIYQSIVVHGGGGKRRTNTGLFPDTAGTGTVAAATPLDDSSIGHDNDLASSKRHSSKSKSSPASERFRLAASRVISLYAMNQGAEVANILCNDLSTFCRMSDTPPGPRPAIWEVLKLVKLTCLDCANLFGGSKRAGPIPGSQLQEEAVTSFTALALQQQQKSGVILDVERLFEEKVLIYPHASEFLECTRNSVIAIILKIAIKAVMEHSRFLQFGSNGQLQFVINMECFRHLIPHYVEDNFMAEGFNAQGIVLRLLTDASNTVVQERSLDTNNNHSYDDQSMAKSILQQYLIDNPQVMRECTIVEA